jgi:hypothetical protein
LSTNIVDSVIIVDLWLSNCYNEAYFPPLKRLPFMNDYVKIYLYRLANFLVYPFLKFRGYCLGLESIAMEYVDLMKKVCVQDSFNHSFDNIYVQYSLFNGVFFKDDKYNEGVLSISKNVNKPGTMEISSRMALKDVKTFQRFCSDVYANSVLMGERWSLNYENKKIKNIVCNFDIILDSINHKNNKINFIETTLVFDCNFNIISIIKKSFITIRSKYGDDTFPKMISESVVTDNIILDDEFLLINLAIAKDNSPLFELFPEYYMDTVYDYSSTEFKQRLQLYAMTAY